MAAQGKILIIRGGAIGDFILTLPAIAAMRERFSGAWLELLGYPHIAQLALAGGLVNQVRSIEAGSLAAFFAHRGTLSEELADYFAEFDLVISYLYDPDGIFQANVARCSQAQFIQGPHRPEVHPGLAAAKVYLQPLERLAIFDASPIPVLNLGGREASAVLEAGQAPAELALHPGSGSEQKNWPEARWAELLQWLAQRTAYRLLLVGGEAEGERLQRLCAAMPPARLTVAQSLPLVQLGRRLSRCAGFIGHDSGISHLAAAVGLPGLLLWGETAVEVWRPPSTRMVVLAGNGGLSELALETVLARLGEVGPGWGISLGKGVNS